MKEPDWAKWGIDPDSLAEEEREAAIRNLSTPRMGAIVPLVGEQSK